MQIATGGSDASEALCKALDLGPRIVEFSIHVKARGAITLSVTRLLTEEEVLRVATTINQYELKEKDEKTHTACP